MANVYKSLAEQNPPDRGIDISKASFWKDSLKVVESQIDQYVKL